MKQYTRAFCPVPTPLLNAGLLGLPAVHIPLLPSFARALIGTIDDDEGSKFQHSGSSNAVALSISPSLLVTNAS